MPRRPPAALFQRSSRRQRGTPGGLTAAVAAAPLLLHSAFAAPCDLDEYYAQINLDSQDPVALRNSLHSRTNFPHNVIPYTSSSTVDTWDALKVLDANPENESEVIVIYGQTGIDAERHGDSSGWNREHVWPKSYGVGYEGADFSDLHCLRPALWGVNSARGNLAFGECDPGTDAQCRSPAYAQAASDTAKTSLLFMPPAEVRGDIARCLFYMAIRYEGDEQDEDDLELTNCPCQLRHALGNLSVLLAWHAADPPDDRERARSSKVCDTYQANRNPFVDHPSLVSRLWPASSADGSDAFCSEGCGAMDMGAPSVGDGSGSRGDDALVCLAPGDIVVVGVDTDDPDSISIAVLADLQPRAEIKITDDSWTGSGWRSSEGVLTFTAGAEGVPKGTVLLWSSDAFFDGSSEFGQWSKSGQFSLSVSGETLIVYQICADMAGPNHLFAMTTNPDGWAQTPGEVDAKASMCPQELESRGISLALPHKDNYAYSGKLLGTRAELLTDIMKLDSWLGEDDGSLAASRPVKFELSDESSVSQALVDNATPGSRHAILAAALAGLVTAVAAGATVGVVA